MILLPKTAHDAMKINCPRAAININHLTKKSLTYMYTQVFNILTLTHDHTTNQLAITKKNVTESYTYLGANASILIDWFL